MNFLLLELHFLVWNLCLKVYSRSSLWRLLTNLDGSILALATAYKCLKRKNFRMVPQNVRLILETWR